MNSFKRSKVKSLETKCLNLNALRKSRKQMRKEFRKQKKIDKVIYLKERKESRARALIVRTDVETVDASDNRTSHEKVIYNLVNEEKISKKNAKGIEEKKREKVQSKSENKKKELLKEANLKEDKIIKKLEKQLKLNKRKRKAIPKSFVADGLDDLLDFCLEKDRRHTMETGRGFLEEEFDVNVSEMFNENIFQNNRSFDAERRKTESETETEDEKEKENENENENESESESESESENENENERDSSADLKLDVQFSNNQVSKNILNTGMSNAKEIKSTRSRKDANIVSDSKGSWEDIYGRKRDAEGNIVQNINRYIPPAARITTRDTNADNGKIRSLKKQLKGCLNRVTEQNMHYITNQIEAMYMSNTRNNMNYVLSELILESLVSPVITPDRLICENMMLIAILHANIGIEVGANFLEKVVKNFVAKMEKPQDVENKELDNIVLMISHLYNFKVFGHKLLYQILHKLIAIFTEKEIELILIVLKTVGFSLRKDDPNMLKEFIHDLQIKAGDNNERNSRVKYMLDVLLAIKNNNINKIPQYDSSHVEHLKKIIKNVIRKGNTIMQFNISLEDLLRADEIGKWWIVGSAWSGSNDTNIKSNIKEQNKLSFGSETLKLAHRQRMNTDTRRNIFCILMTAEDYLDAFEKLHHLGLKDHQEGEIIHVLMHCCLHESKFNPYYAVLGKKLCDYNRKYQLTIQYTLWDKLKTLATYTKKQLSNLAQFLTRLLIEKALALSILKIVQFTELDKHTMKFLRQIVMGILLHENEQACLQVFERISISPQLHTFRESLRLFINCFVIKNVDSCNILDEEKIILKKRAEFVDKALVSHGAKFVF